MLMQILSRTPLWVWALLAYLIARGVMASRDRTTSLRMTFIIPAVMLFVALQGIVSAFGADKYAVLPWALAAASAVWLTLKVSDPDSVVANPVDGTLFLRGSWIPLMLMLSIFVVKYAVNVLVVFHPELKSQVPFVMLVCAMYGAFNGIFLGFLAKNLLAYRAALGMAASPA